MESGEELCGENEKRGEGMNAVFVHGESYQYLGKPRCSEMPARRLVGCEESFRSAAAVDPALFCGQFQWMKRIKSYCLFLLYNLQFSSYFPRLKE